jgi:hypothetical protein
MYRALRMQPSFLHRGLRFNFGDIAECEAPKEMQLETAYNTIGRTRVQIGLEFRLEIRIIKNVLTY